MMDFSLFYFADDDDSQGGGARYDLLLDGARFADRHGFSAVWTPERHFHNFGGLYPNPAVIGAALATATEQIDIRAGSVNAPLHHPLRIAEEWSVVDNLSNGRAGVSFASGWHPDDFALRPENFTNRRAVMADTVRDVRRLWSGAPLPVVTGTGDSKQVRIYPSPVQREIPVWITCAGSVDTFRLAGQLRAGVLTHLLGQDLDELATKIDEYRRSSATESGRPGQVTLMLHTLLGEDTEEVREIVRAPFSRYLRSSFGLIARAMTGSHDVSLDSMEEEDVDFLVSRSFERYFHDGGLFGDIGQASRMVEKLQRIGVDEVACLIDFGVARETVLKGLELLDQLRRRFSAEA
jgi:natural product biosynthesis luciferase-like monooxygenase protein